MPPYLLANGNEAPSVGIYPGQSALAVGYPALPGSSTPALQSIQNEAVTTGYKSRAVCVAAGMGNHGFTQRQINWRVDYGTAPSVAAWVLQGSVDDVDGDYVQVDTASSISNFTQTVASNFKFFRIMATTITGACTGAIKISCM